MFIDSNQYHVTSPNRQMPRKYVRVLLWQECFLSAYGLSRPDVVAVHLHKKYIGEAAHRFHEFRDLSQIVA